MRGPAPDGEFSLSDPTVPAATRPRRWFARIALWGSVLVIAAAGGLYSYLTSGARLRAVVSSTLEQLQLTCVGLDAVAFSPWRGVEVFNLEIDPSIDSPLQTAPTTQRGEPLLRVPHAQIFCDPWRLLSGEFLPTEVVIRGTTVSLVRDPRSGIINWRLPDRVGAAFSQPPGTRLPRLRVDPLDLQLLVVEDGRPRLARRWVINALFEPIARDPQSTPGYRVQVTRAAGAVTSHSDNDGSAVIDATWRPDKALDARVGWLDFETLRLFMPREWIERLDPLELRGSIRVERLNIDGRGVESARATLDRVDCAVPLERDTLPHDRFLRLSEARAMLTIQRTAGQDALEVSLDAAGRVRDGTAQGSLSGRLTSARTGSEFMLNYESRAQFTGVDFPTAERDPAVLNSPRLPDGIRGFFQDYRPHGRFNATLHIQGAMHGDPGGVEFARPQRFDAIIEPQGTRIRYFRFPYDITDCGGRLLVSSDGVDFDGLNGWHGAGRIRADGHVNHAEPWTGFKLHLSGESIALDESLYAALPEQYQSLWQQTAPIGLADVATTLQRAESSESEGPATTKIDVDARLLSGTVATDYGTLLTRADATLSVKDGVVTLHDLHGYDADSAIRISGVIDTLDGASPPRTDLHVEAADLPLARRIDSSSGDAATANVAFSGTGDVWGRRGNTGDHSFERQHYAARIKRGSVTSFDPAAAWENCAGWVSLRNVATQILSFSANRGESRMFAFGLLPSFVSAREWPTLDVDASSPDVDQLIHQLTPPAGAALARSLAFSGAGRVAARVRPAAATGSSEGGTADIRIEAEQARPKALPLNLYNVDAELMVTPEGFDARRISARYGAQGELKLSGHGEWRDREWAEFRVNASTIEFCDNLVNAMPPNFASMLNQMAPRGDVSVALERVRYDGPADQSRWRFEGGLALERAALRLGLPLSGCKGELSGNCSVGPGEEFSLAAAFAIERGLLAGRPIQRWDGQLARNSGERWLRLNEVRGRICDGEIIGFAKVDATTGDYELSANLTGVDLDQFLLRRERSEEGAQSGRLDGHVFLRGVSDKESTRRGGGELRIVGATFLRTPVLASVAEAKRRTDPALSDSLDIVNLTFVWQGAQLQLTRVDIQGRDLRLVGTGTWDLNTDRIELTLVGASPRNWPRIALLSDLVELAGQELMQYRVDGPVASPRVTVEPLHNLTEPIRKLLSQ